MKRLRRLLLAIVALALIALLLELNRFLPGGWPGGGGAGGFPSAASATAGDLRDGERTPPEERDAFPPTLPRDGRLIEVRRADGAPVTEWRLGVGDAGAEDARPRASDGRLVVTDRRVGAEGFRVRADRTLVRHRATGPLDEPGLVSVVLPRTKVPPAKQRGPVRVTVRDADTGAPVPGLELTFAGGAATTRADGSADIVGLSRPVQVGLESGVWMGGGTWVSPRSRSQTVSVRRRPAAPDAARVRPLAWHVKDAAGRTVPDARVRLHYELPARGGNAEPETRTVALEGTAGAVPRGVAVTAVITAPGKAPLVEGVAAEDRATPREVVLEDGLPLPVRVRTEDGRAVANATVRTRAGVEAPGARDEVVAVATQAAVTSPDGSATLHYAAGQAVEIYATADGHAWQRALARVERGMAAVELVLGRAAPLRLVVETPEGLPIEGVEVEVTPEDGGPPLVVPPEMPAWVTDAQGLLALEVPERVYLVRLSKSGFAMESIHRVRPGNVTYFATLVPKD